MDAPILIVDADAAVAAVTTALVHQMAPKLSVRVAPDPVAAVTVLRVGYPGALIIDPAPDEQASTTLIAQLRARDPPVPVFVVASWLSPTLRSRLQELGVEAMIEKPALAGGGLRAFLAGAVIA